MELKLDEKQLQRLERKNAKEEKSRRNIMAQHEAMAKEAQDATKPIIIREE